MESCELEEVLAQRSSIFGKLIFVSKQEGQLVEDYMLKDHVGSFWLTNDS